MVTSFVQLRFLKRTILKNKVGKSMWPHSNRKKDEVTPVESRDRKKKDRLHQVLTNRKKCSRAIPGVLNFTYKGLLSHSQTAFPKSDLKQTAMYMYSVLSSLISLSTSKESEMLLLTGSYYSDCKDLRKHLKKMRTWQPNCGTPIGAYKYIYRAHSAVFSAAEYTFQSTQLGLFLDGKLSTE